MEVPAATLLKQPNSPRKTRTFVQETFAGHTAVGFFTFWEKIKRC